jgi:Ketopantoate reductase
VKILILGLGVIGTTYAYLFQKAGAETEHFIRESKRTECPETISVRLLDGRKNPRGQELRDSYAVHMAQRESAYDLILVSVPGGRLKEAIDTLNENRLSGPILVFSGIWEDRRYVDTVMGGRKYLLGYPVAGGQIEWQKAELNSVLFGHVMLERAEKADIDGYAGLISLFDQAEIKTECPFDMLEWIWLHMAINAGVIANAAAIGDIRDSAAAAGKLMDNPSALNRTIRTIRECTKVAAARGADLRNYADELAFYKFPAGLGGMLMKHMFRTNQLTRRIMELHANRDDLLYVCRSVYHSGRDLGVSMPLFEKDYADLEKKLVQTKDL